MSISWLMSDYNYLRVFIGVILVSILFVWVGTELRWLRRFPKRSNICHIIRTTLMAEWATVGLFIFWTEQSTFGIAGRLLVLLSICVLLYSTRDLLRRIPEFIGQVGIITWKDGRRYEGDWLPNGHGKMTYPDGHVEEGLWKDGRFLGAEKSP